MYTYLFFCWSHAFNVITIECTTDEKRNAVLNFGVGGEIFIKGNIQGFFGFCTDFNAFEGENTYFDFQTSNIDELNAGTDFWHFSGGIDWDFRWGNVILGLIYTRGTNTVSLIDSDVLNSLPLDFKRSVDIKTSKLQFLLGFEIPFINKTTKSIKQQFKRTTSK